jgi:hypothetical protein
LCHQLYNACHFQIGVSTAQVFYLTVFVSHVKPFSQIIVDHFELLSLMVIPIEELNA